MTVASTLHDKLSAAFSPAELDIVDESALHAGHAGSRAEGETHFRVRVVSARFEGLSRVQRQRLIHDVLAGELRERVHALSVSALTPDEAGKKPGA